MTPIAKGMHATVGTVTSIDGSSFTINPAGSQAETIVSIDELTTFRENGQATSPAVLEVGSQVAVIGTTTSEIKISATVVSVTNKGFDFVTYFLEKFGIR